MFGIVHYSYFLISFITLLILPGPNTMMIVSNARNINRKAGFITLCGIILGDQLIIWAALTGVAAFLKTSPTLFEILKVVGGIYLFWIGLELIRSKGDGRTPSRNLSSMFFKQGFMLTILNPKAVIFFMTFLPIFIQTGQINKLVPFLFLSLNILIITFSFGSLLIYVSTLNRGVYSVKLQFWINKICGLILCVVAVAMIIE